MIKKLLGISIGAMLLLAVPIFAQAPESKAANTEREQTADVARIAEAKPGPAPVNVMRDYRGVRLGMTQEKVHAVMGNPSRKDQTWDEFKLDKDDLMTVHYDTGVVKEIQLYFADADRAPEFSQTVGDIEPTAKENGARFARHDIEGEHFWISMYESADNKITTVSFGRLP